MDPVTKIIVIRRDNIGDLVCTTPMVRALREHYPKARICALVNSYNVAVVANNPDLDAVYAYTKAKHRAAGQSYVGVYWARLRTYARLRAERFDYAIIAGAHFLPRALGLARAIHPRHIVGFVEPGARGARHIDIALPYELPCPMHEAEDIFRLLRPLGIDGPPPPARVYPESGEVARVQAALGAPDGRPVIGVHISARKPSNRWPTERVVAVIRRLHAECGARFLLFWSPGAPDNPRHPGDDDKARAILDAVGATAPLVPWQTQELKELVAGLACCDQVFCSDGGAMHLAAALGKPTVALFGKSDVTRWHPWAVPHVALQPPSLDVKDISVEQVCDAFARLPSNPAAARAADAHVPAG
jgi:ADP-heptose:LPS heptosyltransferase